MMPLESEVSGTAVPERLDTGESGRGNSEAIRFDPLELMACHSQVASLPIERDVEEQIDGVPPPGAGAGGTACPS